MPTKELETATIAGGCFWCLEAISEQLKGVEKVQSGYTAGRKKDPTYEEVCSGMTGHAEAVNVTFDPTVISFKDLLEVFFTIHDPTTLNRQGPDVGTQYRSGVYYHDNKQKKTTEEVIKAFDKKKIWANPIVTEVAPFKTFYAAEDYHSQYYRNNPNQSYCRFVIEPKVSKFRKKFVDRLKK